MPSTNSTPNINLSQFVDTDKPTWRGDYNADMGKIDADHGSLSGRIGTLESEYTSISGVTPKSLADYGVLPGNTDIQNRAAFIAAQNSGHTWFTLPAGTYNWSAAKEGDWMMTFTNTKNVRIDGSNATINDTTTYSNNGPFTGLVLLDNCKDSEINLNYVGPVLTSPQTLLGYQGAMLVRAINGTDGVVVRIRAANCRYGVQTGDYADPSKGQCRNFDVTLYGVMVGYALAMYYADGIKHEVEVLGVHRAVYIAGCNDVAGNVRYRDQYIAPIAYVISDVLIGGTDTAAQANPATSPTVSRGSTNIDIRVEEIGSTVFQPSSTVAGISLSRVDPCIFKNIKISAQSSTSSNTLSTTVGAFTLNSTANGIWSRYTKNWSPNILLENIDVNVTCDHSGQTIGGSTAGDIYISTYDGTVDTAATVRNLNIRGTVKKSSNEARADLFMVPGLIGAASANLTHNGTLTVLSNANAPIKLSGKYNIINVSNMTNGSPLMLSGAQITAYSATSLVSNTIVDNESSIGGAGPIRHVAEATLTLSGNTAYFTGIPNNCLVIGVQTKVITAITGATGYQVGFTGETNRYGDNLGVAVGTVSNISSYATTQVNPRYYPGSVALQLNAIGGSFTGGSVRVIVTYDVFPDPL